MSKCTCPDQLIGQDHLPGCPCRLEVMIIGGIKKYRIGDGPWSPFAEGLLPIAAGFKYWCLSPTIEQIMKGHKELQEPWFGILEAVEHYGGQPGNTQYQICRPSKRKDFDNANCAWVKQGMPLFETQEEAKRAYVSLKLQEIHDEMAVSVNKLHVLKVFMLKEGIS